MRMTTMGLGRVTFLAGATVLALSAGTARAADEHEAEQFHVEPPILGTLLIDRFEHRWRDGENSIDWDVQGWIGGDTNKIWFNAEGSKPVEGGAERAEF